MACVLLVEDEDDIRSLLAEILKESGFSVVEAETGDAAVPLLSTEGVTLVVTDIDMPGQLDGVGLALTARKIRPDIPVIFITGRPGKLAEAQVLPDPVSFLMKPFRWSNLLSNIDRLGIVPCV